MSRDLLGSGLKFPVQTTVRGGLAVSRYEEKVRESVRIILSTAKGERVMRPEFGCGIHEFTFMTLDRTSRTLICSAVRDALERWEPRIEQIQVDAEMDDERQGRLILNVAYRVRLTKAIANLVYPFDLEGAGV